MKPLTQREMTVARQVIVGLPLKVIAGNLSISVQAVSTYLGRVRRKLAVRSRCELAALMSGREPSLASLASTSPPPHLTAAELAIGVLILEGRSNAWIAESRRTSLRTAEKQVSGFLHKLGVTTRNELIALTIPTSDDGQPGPCRKTTHGSEAGERSTGKKKERA